MGRVFASVNGLQTVFQLSAPVVGAAIAEVTSIGFVLAVFRRGSGRGRRAGHPAAAADGARSGHAGYVRGNQRRVTAVYHFGTRRAVPPSTTLRRIKPLLAPAGITRLADVTGLDWIGIPVYQAIRPNSRNLSVAQGKGLTRTQAKVSALMESLESFHAERIDQPVMRATFGQMRRQLDYDPRALPVVRAGSVRDPAYDPFAPPVGEPTLVRDHTVVDWVAATDSLPAPPRGCRCSCACWISRSASGHAGHCSAQPRTVWPVATPSSKPPSTVCAR